MKAFDKIKKLQSELSEMVLERENQIEGSLAALIAGVHVLLLGPPGTAKSLLANGICKAIKGGKFFSYLMTKFTLPEEVWGPYSLKGLKEDRFERVTKGYLPECHIAFLDEVFKASSAVSNTLLWLLNERTFRNGGDQPQPVPLLSCFGASNELPRQEELGAYSDRFALRYWVEYIHDVKNRVKMAKGDLRRAPETTLTLDELAELRAEAEKVTIPDELWEMLCGDISLELSRVGVKVSDRKLRTAATVLKAIAYLRGLTEVTADELEALGDMLWEKPAQKNDILKVVSPYANPLNLKAIEYLDQATELYKNWEKSGDPMGQGMVTAKSLNEMLKQIDGDMKDRPAAKIKKLAATRSKVAEMSDIIYKKCVG